MSDALKAEIRGLKAAQKAMTAIVRELNGTPILNAMRDATLIVLRSAKINVPVDTGRLNASITPEVKQAGTQVIGIVGTKVKYGAKIEQPGRVRRKGQTDQRVAAVVVVDFEALVEIFGCRSGPGRGKLDDRHADHGAETVPAIGGRLHIGEEIVFVAASGAAAIRLTGARSLSGS